MPNTPKDRANESGRVVSIANWKANKNKEDGFTAPTSPNHPALRAMRKKENNGQ